MKRELSFPGGLLAAALGLLAPAVAPGLASAQEARSCGPELAAQLLHVVGDVAHPLALGAAELREFPRRRVQVEDRDGPAEFEGIPLLELLRAAGVPVESLRGAQTATVVVAEASDGYRAAYSLAELDDTFSGRLFILADRRGDAALGEDEGPVRVVGQGEPRRSRWIRGVRCLRVVAH